MKKTENTDALHHEYGALRNTGYILGAFKKYRKSMFFWVIAGGIAGASMAYIWSFIGKLVIDMIERQASSGGEIFPLVRLVIIASIVELVMLALNNISRQKMSVGFTATRLMLVRERIAKSLSMEYETLESPEMLDRLQKAKRATDGDWNGVQGMMNWLSDIFQYVVSVITATAILTTFDPLVILVIVALSAVQFAFFEYTRKKDKREMWDACAPIWRKMHYMEHLTTDFRYAKDIRLFGMKNFISRRQGEILDDEFSHWKKSRQYWLYNSIFYHGVMLLQNGVVIAWLIWSMIEGKLSIGNFTLYFSSSTAFSGALNQLFQAVSGIRERSAQTDDFRSYMDIPTGDAGGKAVPKCDKYEFKFENVSFRYKGQEGYALRNINITLHPGEKLAVVGLNGAGKSTFIKLLTRLYDVTEGHILLNGTDIREFDRQEYFRLFSPAFQDTAVFAFPMNENVSMREPERTDKEYAEKALRDAGLGEKIDSLEHGADTELLKVLHDDGIDLSGGERQKLALARALYKRSDIIVLDEPTAALDALAEYRLYQSFDDMIGGKSAVYISHRLSSTRFCDRIAMFAGGEIAEMGTHEELLAKGGPYAEMFKVQAQYYVEDRDVILEGGEAYEN